MQQEFKTQAPYLASRMMREVNAFLIKSLAAQGFPDVVPAHGDLFVALFDGRALSVSELARQTSRTKSTVSVMIDRLEQLGYMKKERDADDSRQILVSLTQKGETLEPVFQSVSQAITKKMLTAMSQKEALELERLLAASYEAFQS